MSAIFYHDSELLQGDKFEVEGGEFTHIANARRISSGDQILVTNGKGVRVRAQVEEISVKKKLTAVVSEREELPEPFPVIILASAVPKGERQGILLSMATQLGVNGFIPLHCEFSMVRYEEKMQARWERLIVSACKQSGQCYFPTIYPPHTIGQLINGRTDSCVVVAGDPGGKPIQELAVAAKNEIKKIILIIGPEGGFSSKELKLLSDQKILKLRLSNQILRTETAAVSILSVINQINWK